MDATTRQISVALATHNGAGHLGCQLDSLAGQTVLPDELVVTDDASTDDTPAILAAFAASAPFAVRIHRNPQRLGFVQNFDRALSLCTGELVFLCDQDDYWLPTKIETVRRAADEHPSRHLFMNDAWIADEALEPSGQSLLGRMKTAGMSFDRLIQGSCAAIRRPFLDIVLPVPREAHAHDAWIVGLGLDYGNRLLVEMPLQLYRRHDASVSRSITAGTDRLGRFAYLGGLARTRLLSDTPAYLDAYLAETALRLQRVREWLATASAGHELHGKSIDVATKLERRIAAIHARAALLRAPGLRRMPGVVRLLRRGHYSEFAGARTALRDLAFLDRVGAALRRGDTP